MTDILGQSQILSYIIKLSQKGCLFTLISFEKADKYREFEPDIRAICAQYNIRWIPLMYSKRPPVLSTVWDVFKLGKQLRKSIQNDGCDIIHCRSYLTSLVALKMKRKYGIPFIFDMRGFYADERVEGDLWNLKNPIYRSVYKYLKKKELQFIQHSDAIVSLTSAGAEIMKTWWDKDSVESKLTIIPCAADFDLFELRSPEKQNICRQNLGIPNDSLVITYLGTMGTWYLFEEIIYFFSWFKKKEPKAKFLMISPNKREQVLNVTNKYKLSPQDVFVHFAKRQEVSNFLEASDLGIFFIKPSFSKKSSSPTKLGEMLAKGIPVLTNSGVGDVDQILKDLDCGIALEQIEEPFLEQKKKEIFDLLNKDSAEIRKNARSYFDLDEAAEKYLQIYNRILG